MFFKHTHNSGLKVLERALESTLVSTPMRMFKEYYLYHYSMSNIVLRVIYLNSTLWTIIVGTSLIGEPNTSIKSL